MWGETIFVIHCPVAGKDRQDQKDLQDQRVIPGMLDHRDQREIKGI
jgi:hypothetical protein